MTELIYVDLLASYDENDFDINPSSIGAQEFTDPKGQKQKYCTGLLTYKGLEPYFLAAGNSYGIQKGQKEGEEGEGGSNPPPNMVQLPSAQKKAGEDKKEKWQVSVTMSHKPAPKDWTAEEAQRIDFLENKLRRIVSGILARRLDILQKVNPNIVIEAQQKIVQEIQKEPAKFPDQTSQAVRFTEIIRDLCESKLTKKVYRKKKKAPEGAAATQINFMDLSSQFDETSYPTLYASIISFMDKKKKEEVFVTKYYKGDKKIEESQWKELSHAEAVGLGPHSMEVAVRFGNLYFGAQMSVQLKAGEVVLFDKIESKMGHKGRLVRAPADVKRDNRLITRTAIQPAGSPQNDNNAPAFDPSAQLNQQFNSLQLQQQDQAAAANVFNPATLQGVIPGIGAPQLATTSNANPNFTLPGQINQ
jgi:hypothetical protein